MVVVGKRGGKASSVPQTDINQILVQGAAEHNRVVRMKGGDPLVYGRVQQEMVALRAAGVPFEVVPGQSSEISAGRNPLTRICSRTLMGCFVPPSKAGRSNPPSNSSVTSRCGSLLPSDVRSPDDVVAS